MPRLLPNWTSVGFSGHRRLANPQLVADALRTALDDLTKTHGPLAAVASTASGADTLFVEEVVHRQLPYFLIFPFSQERFRQDFSQEQWDRVAAHFAGALAIEEIQDADEPNEGYMECGFRTVDRADVLVAVWDGEPAAGLGGTGDVVQYARGLGKPLIWIDPATGAIRKERFEPTTAESNGPINVDDATPLRTLVERQYAEFDDDAAQHGPAAQQLTLLIIRLHLAATALAIAGLVLGIHGGWEHAITVAKLAALSIALWLAWRHHHCHHEWMNSRIGAEICRSYLAIWPMRRRHAHFPSLGADEPGHLVRSLQMAWYLDKDAERPLDEARELYIHERIRDQLAYFNRKYRADGQRARRLRLLATAATIAALVFGVLALGFSVMGVGASAYKIVKLLAVVLPLVPPAALSVVVSHDLARRAARHGDVTAKLERAEHRLKLCRTWPGLWREVIATEDLLLREVGEWYSLARYAGESH